MIFSLAYFDLIVEYNNIHLAILTNKSGLLIKYFNA